MLTTFSEEITYHRLMKISLAKRLEHAGCKLDDLYCKANRASDEQKKMNIIREIQKTTHYLEDIKKKYDSECSLFNLTKLFLKSFFKRKG